MTDVPRTCFPAAEAPVTTGLYARCQVCGVQWQVHGAPPYDNVQGCSFCDAPASAITVLSEDPNTGSGGRRRT